MTYTVSRTIAVPNWDEPIRQKAKAFWAARRISFTEESEHVLIGRRGNLARNFVSYDTTWVVATVTITSLEPSKIDCVLVVDTTGQHWTEWNKAYVELEVATFESHLLFDDDQEHLWKRFMKGYGQAALKWTMTFGILGSRMSASEKAEFRSFC